MRPLANRYGLRPVSERESKYEAEVAYTNNTTGLRVRIDWAEFRAFLTICQLENESWPPEHRGSTAIAQKCFDVDDLLLLRARSGAPVGKMLARRDEDLATQLLEEYAAAIDQHAGDVLSGDFTIFDKLSDIVADRRRRMGSTT